MQQLKKDQQEMEEQMQQRLKKDRQEMEEQVKEWLKAGAPLPSAEQPKRLEEEIKEVLKEPARPRGSGTLQQVSI